MSADVMPPPAIQAVVVAPPPPPPPPPIEYLPRAVVHLRAVLTKGSDGGKHRIEGHWAFMEESVVDEDPNNIKRSPMEWELQAPAEGADPAAFPLSGTYGGNFKIRQTDGAFGTTTEETGVELKFEPTDAERTLFTLTGRGKNIVRAPPCVSPCPVSSSLRPPPISTGGSTSTAPSNCPSAASSSAGSTTRCPSSPPRER